MEAVGGRIAMHRWADGKGYNIETFMPWSYVRLSGQPLKSGQSFVFGWETMWAKAGRSEDAPETGQVHRIADGVKSIAANRIFMFRARRDWGRVVIGDHGALTITEDQKAIQQRKLAAFTDYATQGSIPIVYELPTGGATRPRPPSAPRERCRVTRGGARSWRGP
jgi:hypothetical protein